MRTTVEHLSPKVMIVEDSMLVALDLESILTDCGFEVVGRFGDLDRSLAFIAASPPDLALLDYRLSDGTCEQLALSLNEKRIPYVLCTGFAESNVKDIFAETPIIKKPYRPKEVCDVVASFFP